MYAWIENIKIQNKIEIQLMDVKQTLSVFVSRFLYFVTFTHFTGLTQMIKGNTSLKVQNSLNKVM